MDYIWYPDLITSIVQMLPFATLLNIDKTIAVPVYRQIANGIVNAISSGLIGPGSGLPGTRDLAQQLGVHRKTIIAAYDELYAQSWIEIRPRKGVKVAQNLPGLKPQQWDELSSQGYSDKIPTDFYRAKAKKYLPKGITHPQIVIDDGLCDPRLSPIEMLMREYKTRAVRRYKQRAIHSTLAAGAPMLREALVNYFAQTRGLQVQVSNILVTQGAQMSLYIAANLLLKPGDVIIVGNPNYFVASQVFEQTGARIMMVPVDDHGMDVNAVEQVCNSNKIKALYVIPHHHHPTTVTLSAERRMRLLELAREHNFIIIEDDYDYDFHYTSSPYLPLASSKHNGRVIYIGSFSKSISSSVRIGFMIGPDDFIEEVAYLRRLIDLRGDYLMEEALATLLVNGDISRHLKKSNKIYEQRRDNLCTLLQQYLPDVITFDPPNGGMALWARFKKEHALPAIAARAANVGLAMSNGVAFNTDQDFNATRIGFASLTTEEMEEAILTLKGVI